MKTVFNNHECMHIFAQQTHDQGRTNNGNVFFTGDTIYSYGHHFPMAHFIDNNTVLVNNDSYSVSTSSHQSDLGGAICHHKRFFVSTEILKHFLYSQEFDKYFRGKLVDYALSESKDNINKASKRRKASLKDQDLSSARDELQEAIDIFSHFKKKPPVKLTKALELLNNDIDSVIASHKTAIDKEKAVAVKKEKAKQAKLMLNADKWRTNTLEQGESIWGLKDTLMRVNGDRVETSKNAHFPVTHAKVAFYKILDCVRTGTPWKTNGRTINLGNFKIDYIHENGDVKAGCHFVKYSEIERVAKELNLSLPA